MNLEFDKRLFNPLFWKLRETGLRIVISYGGAGSSKSYSQAQNEIIKNLEGVSKILVIRKVANTIKDSVQPLVEEILKDWDIWHIYDFNKVEHTFTNRINGAQIICRGLDDPEKIKSIQGIKRIWVEEASECTQDDVEQLNLRMRGEGPFQMTLTFNPIIETHWLKKYFFDNDRQDVAIFKTTYLDNPFIDEQYKKTLEGYKLSNPYRYQVYALGDWGVMEAENPFAFNYDSNKHESEVSFDPRLPIYISIDFNLMPFCAIFAQLMPGKFVHVFDSLEIKKGSIPEMIDEISSRYGQYRHNFRLTGDAMGKRGDLTTRDNASYYEQIRRGLKINLRQLDLPANPTHKASRNQVNYILFHHPEVKINPKTCFGLIRDLKTVQVNADESLIKKNRSKIEEQADFLDTFRYLCNTYLHKWHVSKSRL